MDENEQRKLDLSHLSVICELKNCGEDPKKLLKEWENQGRVFSERLKIWVEDLVSDNPKIPEVIETIDWCK